jgi:hypothetical protein
MENGGSLETKQEDPSSSSDSDDGIDHDADSSAHVVGGEKGEERENTVDGDANKAEVEVPVALSEDSLQEIELQQRRV